MIPAAVLCLLSSTAPAIAPQPQPQHQPPPPAHLHAHTPTGPRLELSRGRAELLGDDPRTLEASPRHNTLPPQGELSLSPAARARLSWNGNASLELEGPCRLAWNAIGSRGTQHFVRFVSLSRAEVEVRAGADLCLRLPESFDLAASGSAFSVDRRASGSNVRVHAGADLRVSSLVSRPAGTWPARIAPGTAAALAPAAD